MLVDCCHPDAILRFFCVAGPFRAFQFRRKLDIILEMPQRRTIHPDILLHLLSEANDRANSLHLTDLGNSLAHWRHRTRSVFAAAEDHPVVFHDLCMAMLPRDWRCSFVHFTRRSSVSSYLPTACRFEEYTFSQVCFPVTSPTEWPYSAAPACDVSECMFFDRIREFPASTRAGLDAAGWYDGVGKSGA